VRDDCGKGVGWSTGEERDRGRERPRRNESTGPIAPYKAQHSTAQHSTAQHSTAQHSVLSEAVEATHLCFVFLLFQGMEGL
jgi:hypothetical protein